MKLADGYPRILAPDHSAGHKGRVKARASAVTVFTVNYLASENQIFTELYQRSLIMSWIKDTLINEL